MICVGFGPHEGNCTNPAGSSHSDLWCQRCDDLRLAHITKRFETIAAGFVPVPPDQTEVAWLIERGQPEKQAPTLWWCGAREFPEDTWVVADEWTADANHARRFPTKAAAEGEIRRDCVLDSGVNFPKCACRGEISTETTGSR